MKITSKTILDALAVKHNEDVFVPECKNGPSNTGYSRLDAWAMAKSWAHPRVVGYEIKVSRADFINDSKWQEYLPMCNELYFAAPKGLIKESEVSPEVGLIELVGTSRLVIRKKAQHRDIKIQEDVFRYILMCRARIGDERVKLDNKLDYWRGYVAEKEEGKELGWRVSRKVRDHVDKVRLENKNLRLRMETYDDVVKTLEQLGFQRGGYIRTWEIEDRVKTLKSLVPPEFKSALESLNRGITEVNKQILKIEQETSSK